MSVDSTPFWESKRRFQFKSISFFLLLSTALAQPSSCRLGSEKELPQQELERFQHLLNSGADMAAIRYDVALHYARIGNQQKALETLGQALAVTPWLDPAHEPDFEAMQQCDGFQMLVKRVEQKYPPRAAGRVAFTIAQKDLIPEGLAADPRDGTLYLSSTYHRKIVKISTNGEVSDFVHEAQDGLLGVLGMKVDPHDGSLWAASERSDKSALFHFDRSGRTLGQYAPLTEGKHLFNDLVVTRSHDVFVTDSEDASVYRLAADSNKLERIDLGGRVYPNGIALGNDDATLYVAHAFGLARVDVASGTISEVVNPPGVSIAMADGLYYHHGRLIAIQNGFGANRIVELQLSADGRSVTSGRLLEFRSSTLELPTTGAVYGNKFYYIVNSQLDHYEDAGELKREEDLKPVKIAILDLLK